MKTTFTLFLPNEKATLSFGAQVAPVLKPGFVIYLEGPLGAGKTTLVRGLLHKLGHQGIVKSPTYTLIEPYELLSFKLYHWDLYRIISPLELDSLGQTDCFDGESVHLIEWAQHGAACLEAPDWTLALALEKNGRQAQIEAHTQRGSDSLLQLMRKHKNR